MEIKKISLNSNKIWDSISYPKSGIYKVIDIDINATSYVLVLKRNNCVFGLPSIEWIEEDLKEILGESFKNIEQKNKENISAETIMKIIAALKINKDDLLYKLVMEK